MEVVNLVYIKYGRFGTANGGFSNFGSIYEKTVETDSVETEDLRQLVISEAKLQGETGPLDQLRRTHGNAQSGLTFDLQTSGTSYSTPYAVCLVFPALKANGRYFKLTEVPM